MQENDAGETPAPIQNDKISVGGSFGIGAAIGGVGILAGLTLIGLSAFGGVLAFGAGAAATVFATQSTALAMTAGGIAGVAAFGLGGYGTFKLAKKVYTALRNNPRLDKTWAIAGAATGAVGVMLFPNPSFVEIKKHVPEIKSSSIGFPGITSQFNSQQVPKTDLAHILIAPVSEAKPAPIIA